MSREWRHPSSPRPKKARSSISAEKVMLSFFFDEKGPLLIDWLETGEIISAPRYCDTLNKLQRAIRQKQQGMLSKGVIVLHDNVRPRVTDTCHDTLQRFGWEVLAHPLYSPDLVPCDFHIFGPLKQSLKGRWFTSSAEVCQAVEEWLATQPASFYAEGIHKVID
jgi:histone-lysine N-methyltransferase SETMAR